MSGIAKLFSEFWDYLLSLFFSEEHEFAIVGIQFSGKSAFLELITKGRFSEESRPTLGFAREVIKKNNVTMKVWDLGGQSRFRQMWERYCKKVDCILFMVDSSDLERMDESRKELHDLVSKPSLTKIPILVLGNKRDLPGSLNEKEFVEKMDVSNITDREIFVYMISCKNRQNIDKVLQWIRESKKNRQ